MRSSHRCANCNSYTETLAESSTFTVQKCPVCGKVAVVVEGKP